MSTPAWQKYLTPRGGGNSWSLRPALIDAWRRRDFYSVPPLCAEFAPILECNANCPGCPYRRSRQANKLGIMLPGLFPTPNDVTCTHWETAKLIIERTVESGAEGILYTGGGEPTIWEHLPDALRHGTGLGLVHGLYTNGFQFGIDPQYAGTLLAPENGLVFIRVSVNAATRDGVRKHWGVDMKEQELQWAGLRNLFAARKALATSWIQANRPIPSIQISSVFDKNNIADIENVCEAIAVIATEFASLRAAEDVMVVRPSTIYGRSEYSTHDHDEERVIQAIINAYGRRGSGRDLIERAGYRLFMGFGLDRIERKEAATYRALVEEEYAQRDVAWSSGCFLTIGPGGTVHLSTSHNCDPRWALGDLKKQSVAEIYRSEQRRAIIDNANSLRWGPSVEQPTARTNRLDRIARAIQNGSLRDEDIAHIASHALHDHRLLLD